jgi:hypothetical protein
LARGRVDGGDGQHNTLKDEWKWPEFCCIWPKKKKSKKTQRKEGQKQVEGEKEIRKGEREKGERRRAFVNNKIT